MGAWDGRGARRGVRGGVVWALLAAAAFGGQEPVEVLDDPAETLDPVVRDTAAEDEAARERARLEAEIRELRTQLESLTGRPLSWLAEVMPSSPIGRDDDRPPPSLTETLLREDETVRAAFRDALIARYHREAQILDERRTSIAWTNWIGRFVFLVVHGILFLGLRAALGEFAHAARTRRATPEATELRVSLEGVALKTSLHGFLILVAAFAFYVVYLRLVYPVTVLD